MMVVYTYEGHRDPAFEDGLLGVVRQFRDARQVSSRERPDGVSVVALDVDLDEPRHELVDRLRAHERVIDVTQGATGPEA